MPGAARARFGRWILENDWLEALVALPEQMFYNTGIATYVWILTNRKALGAGRQGAADQRGGFLDPDAEEPRVTSAGRSPRKSATEILDLYEAFEESELCRIYPTEHFGYRKVTVERPLRLDFDASPERIAQTR